jgi:Flp pilus assembly protein TadB
VAQTKRRRRTKHRGNAAGVVEARGRTGRKPTAAEKGSAGAQAAGSREKRREERYDRPPTWRGAFYRALFAAALLLVLGIVLLHSAVQAIIYFVFALIAYTPISYYTDMWMYRRRQRTKLRSSK